MCRENKMPLSILKKSKSRQRRDFSACFYSLCVLWILGVNVVFCQLRRSKSSCTVEDSDESCTMEDSDVSCTVEDLTCLAYLPSDSELDALSEPNSTRPRPSVLDWKIVWRKAALDYTGEKNKMLPQNMYPLLSDVWEEMKLPFTDSHV